MGSGAHPAAPLTGEDSAVRLTDQREGSDDE